MIITKEIQTTALVTKDVICNKCGESCQTNRDPAHPESNPQFDGLIEVDTMGGYWSKIIGDGNMYRFSLCETCLVEFCKSFKIDAFIDGWPELADEEVK